MFHRTLWIVSAVTFLWGIRLLYSVSGGFAGFSTGRKEIRELQRVAHRLHELEEMLESGVPPLEEHWGALRDLPAPWGPLAWQSLTELRASGGALLPTLKRLRTLAESHRRASLEGRARASQALSQTGACILLVPIFSWVLHGLLPGVEEHPWIWAAVSTGSFVLSVMGAFWLHRLSTSAKWGGLKPAKRAWVLWAQCAGERFLALVRGGTPPDLAWLKACELLRMEAPGLALGWGYSVFGALPELAGTGSGSASSAESSLLEAGHQIRRAIQVSLMEGRPCSERVESVLASLRTEVAAQIERELSLLGTRALKPLFLCVAPALFGLLGAGLALSWQEVLGNGGF